MFSLFRRMKAARTTTRSTSRSFKPRLEVLEDRCVPAVTTFTSRAAWLKALAGASTRLIDFNEASPGTPASTQYASEGIIFDPDMGVFSIISGRGAGQNVLDTAFSGQTHRWHFTEPVFAVGWDRTSADDRHDYEIFDTSGILIGHLDLDTPTMNGGPLFGGFISDIPIGRGTSFSPNGDRRHSIDNIQFAIQPTSDINLLSAQLQSGNTVQFTYETTGNPGTFEVGLYRSADATFDASDSLLDTQTVTPSPTNPQAPGTFTLPSPWTGDSSEPYLVVVADPRNDIGESSEANNVQSLALPFLNVVDTTSPDPDHVSVTYHIDNAALPAPFQVDVTRLRGTAEEMGYPVQFVIPAQDSTGANSLAIGEHTVIFTLAQPLGIDPDFDRAHPTDRYDTVRVTADPAHRLVKPNDLKTEAEFKIYTLGAVSVGLQLDFAAIFGTRDEQWVTTMADSLKKVLGYTEAIPFVWSSFQPSSSALPEAGQDLANRIEQAVANLNAGPDDVIDLHLIGHSRGSVVISQAMEDLLTSGDWAADSPLGRGYVKMTLLDPHPANNAYGLNASFNPLSVVLGLPLAGYLGFQAVASDPCVVVPARVNEAEFYYQQHSFWSLPVPEFFLDLQGLSPEAITFQGPATLIHGQKLDQAGLGHSEVHDWYQSEKICGTTYVPGQAVTPVTLHADTQTQADALLAVFDPNAPDYTPLDPPTGTPTPLDITVDFGPDVQVSDSTVVVPLGIQLQINGGVWHGGSPALTLSSGDLTITGATFVNATDAPTILVTGGSLTLRNDTIQETTGGSQAAIAVSGGTVDLGTSADPGRNVLNINGSGALVHNTSPNLVTAIGDAFEIDGTVLTSAARIAYLLNPVTVTAVTASVSPSLLGQPVTLTATVSPGSPALAAGTPSGTVQFLIDGSTVGAAVPLAGSCASISAAGLAVGLHTITALYSGDGSFFSSNATTSPTVIPPASLSGLVFEDFNNDGELDFGERGIGGVPITLTGTDDLGHAVNLNRQTDGDGFYAFHNLRPGSYTLSETQPAGYVQGINSVGTAGGTTASDQFFIDLGKGVYGLNYNFGERPPATGAVQHGQTAGIGFWNNKNGQALIRSLNGGTGTQLGDWLAATFVNLFGANAGANDLTGKDNAYVASFFQRQFTQKGPKLEAQVLATALSVYVTNTTLDDTRSGAKYGFTVSSNGVGTATFNVGSGGEAFGVADGTTMTVLDLLLATDAQAAGGVLYGGIARKRDLANIVYAALNEAGSIG